jgi:hypothetical protein
VREVVDDAPVWGKTWTSRDSPWKWGFGRLGGGQLAKDFYRRTQMGGRNTARSATGTQCHVDTAAGDQWEGDTIVG